MPENKELFARQASKRKDKTNVVVAISKIKNGRLLGFPAVLRKSDGQKLEKQMT